jgi:uncharacterized membrane protein
LILSEHHKIGCDTVLDNSTSLTQGFPMNRFLIVTLAAVLAGCSSPEPESETRLPGRNVLEPAAIQAAQSGKVSFTEHVKPVLEAKCAMCHNKSAPPGRMSLASQAEAIQTGTLGVFIIPGQPEKSRFITHLGTAHSSVKAMPPVGETLTPQESVIIRRWIAQGAEWPAGAAGKLVTER